MPMNILYMVQNSNIETPTMEVLGLQFDILALQYKTNMRTPLPYQQHILRFLQPSNPGKNIYGLDASQMIH